MNYSNLAKPKGTGCRACPVRNCDTLQYKDGRCAELRARFGLADPDIRIKETVDYNVELEGIRCISVNWGERTFTFEQDGRVFEYKQGHYTEADSDVDYIKRVISMYLNDRRQAELDAAGPDQEIMDAEAVLRLFPYADLGTTIWKREGEVSIGVHGCWSTRLRGTLFASVPTGTSTTIGEILKKHGVCTAAKPKAELVKEIESLKTQNQGLRANVLILESAATSRHNPKDVEMILRLSGENAALRDELKKLKEK